MQSDLGITKDELKDVKLPAHRAGLPGKVISSYIMPLPARR
jgi:hypothetical protein